VVWSLGLITLAFVALLPHAGPPTPERLQASAFVGEDEAAIAPSFRLFRASVAVRTCEPPWRAISARSAPPAHSRPSPAAAAPLDRRAEADIHLLRYAEHLLASAIGAASSRLALSLLLRRRNVSTRAALQLLDDASAAIQYNRDLLQHALDHARQGITVFDRTAAPVLEPGLHRPLRPARRVHAGRGSPRRDRALQRGRGAYGPGPWTGSCEARSRSFARETEPVRLRLHSSAKVIEIRSHTLPVGG
jgi:hypothetical protein